MPRMMWRGVGLLVGVFLLPAPAYTWNAFGHRAVAKIACLEITDGQQAAIFKLLQAHPHFATLKDFPKKGKDTDFFGTDRPTAVSEVEWAIIQSATWPDFVRPPKFTKLTKVEIAAHPVYKYHRKFDHFFDIPLIDPKFKTPVKLDNPGTLLKALADAENDLKDPNKTPEEKAIAFCWLAHLAGDIHQPLHCTSFFSADFPNGDGGGNAFLIGKTNLHSYWDGALGSGSSFEHFDAVVHGIHRAPQLQRPKLLELTKNTTYEASAEESNKLAATFAYKNGAKALQGGHAKHDREDVPLEIPDFPANYKTHAKNVAERRVALAGYRLADKIGGIFSK